MGQKTVPNDVPGSRIVSGENWANNATVASLRDDEPSTKIIFNQAVGATDTDRWMITNYLDGYKIMNLGSSNWASISGKEVIGVPDFDGQTCKFFIEYSGKDQLFWIRTPQPGGPVWTIRPGASGGDSTIFLDTLDMESDNQKLGFIVQG